MNANDIIEKCAEIAESLYDPETIARHCAGVEIALRIRALKSSLPAETSGGMTEEQIKRLVDRFLQWQLPKNFNPDAGISYKRPNYAPEIDATPSGTNLFDAAQATDMVRFMVEGITTSSLPAETVSDAMVESLRNIRRAIVEDTTALNDTLWMPDDVPGGKGASVIDYIDQTLEAALAHADDGWRPIESAPRDGTGILVWIKGAKLPFTARWSVARNRWVDMQNDESVYPSPTHWRPLPAPPKDGRE